LERSPCSIILKVLKDEEKTIKKSTMLNLKGFLILSAFAILVYVLMDMDKIIESTEDAIYTYGGSFFITITMIYILIILLEFFVGIEDTDKL